MSTATLERRHLAVAELRAVESGDKHTIVGMAARFYAVSHDLGGFRERILSGAFSKTLRTADVRMLVNHDPSRILGRSKSGTLRVWENAVGLMFECDLLDAQYAKDVYRSIERGDMDQCSFAFRADDEFWGDEQFDDDNDGVAETWSAVRNVKAVTLYDCSIVTFPAYEATTVSATGNSYDVSSLSSQLVCQRAVEYARSHKTVVPQHVYSPAEILRANLSIEHFRAEAAAERAARRRRVIDAIVSES